MSLDDTYRKEEELLVNVLNAEASVSWQRFGSSLVANAFIITGTGVLLNAGVTARDHRIQLVLWLTTSLLGIVGFWLNRQYGKIMERSQGIFLVRWDQLSEIEKAIKEPKDAKDPVKVWDKELYDQRLKEKLSILAKKWDPKEGKGRDPNQITSRLANLSSIFMATFLVIFLVGFMLLFLGC